MVIDLFIFNKLLHHTIKLSMEKTREAEVIPLLFQ
jgi:hypothetical protein